MEDFMEGLTGVLAVSLSLGIPIVAIVVAAIKKVKKSNNDREIRRLIIENHTDPETAKYLVAEPEKKEESNPYSTLRWGCVLIGLGLGAAISYLNNLNPEHDLYFWIMLAFGCGLGLLCSFIIEYRLQKRGKSTIIEPNKD